MTGDEPVECPACSRDVMPIVDTEGEFHCPFCGHFDRRTADAVRAVADDFFERSKNLLPTVPNHPPTRPTSSFTNPGFFIEYDGERFDAYEISIAIRDPEDASTWLWLLPDGRDVPFREIDGTGVDRQANCRHTYVTGHEDDET